MADKNIFILAAGNNRYSDKPCSLWSFGNGKSILDWQTHTIESALPGNEVKIAVGYDYQLAKNTTIYVAYAVMDNEDNGDIFILLYLIPITHNTTYSCRRSAQSVWGDISIWPPSDTKSVLLACDS